MKKVIAIGIVFLFVMMSFNSISGIQIEKNVIQSSGRGNILYVGGSGEGNYTRIQDAIDDATDGDTVFVFDDSSPYYEHVYVNTSINLIGEDRDTTVIDGVVMRADRVNVSGFTLCEGMGGFWGLSNIVISDNHFINNGLMGIAFDGVDNSFIISNTFTNCGDSIFFEGCYSNVIANNIIIFDNLDDWPFFAITCRFGGNHIITNNTCIDYNKESNRRGLQLEHRTDNCIIEDNEFNGYNIGVMCTLSSKNNLFSHNTFINNDNGIMIGIFSAYNKIINNNFINNNNDASVFLAFNNKWDSNYWDDWIGLKIPGLSFLPYFHYDFLCSFIDWHPASEPYNYTTAQGCGIE